MKYYALTLDNEIKLIIPWQKSQPPTPIEFCQAISSVWAKSGPDFSFGETPLIEQFFDKSYPPLAQSYGDCK